MLMPSGTPRTWTLRRVDRENHVEIVVTSGLLPADFEPVNVVELELILDLIEAQLCDPTSVDARRLRGFAHQHGRAIHGSESES